MAARVDSGTKQLPLRVIKRTKWQRCSQAAADLCVPGGSPDYRWYTPQASAEAGEAVLTNFTTGFYGTLVTAQPLRFSARCCARAAGV